jgi:hypothetical protein
MRSVLSSATEAQASRKNATAPNLPRTLSITSVPCLPLPTVSY